MTINTMKKIVYAAIAILGMSLIPLTVLGVPVSWDANKTDNVIQVPSSYSTANVKASHFTATSTAATSTFAGNVVVGDTVRQRNSNLEIGGSALFQDFYGSAIPADWYNKQKSFLSVTGTSIAGTYCEPEDICLGSTVYTYGVLSSPMGSTTGGSSHIGGVYSFYGEPRGDSTNKYGVYLTGENKNYFSGNVGIGTTSPFAKLSVAGDAYIGGNLTATGTLTLQGGTTTAANGFDITDGCFAVDGVCIGSGASLSGGSPNTLTYWTSGSTVGATSSPTVGYITATSTTATSTFGLARIGQPYDISSRLIVNDVLSYITVEAPTGGSATQTESGNYMACGLIYFYNVYAYKIIGGVTVYSSPLQIVFEDYDYTEDCSSTFFDVNLSWTASPGADGYKVVVTADDYIGIYGDAYRATTNTSTVMDGDYTSEYPMVVTPSSPYIILTNPYGLAVIGNTIINGNSNFNGNIYATGTQIISAPNEASGLIIKGKGSGGSPAYHPLKIQNSTGQDNFFFGNSEFNGYGDYAAAGFVGRGSESPYMGDFVWTDANNALPNTDARVAFMSVQGSKSGSTANYRTIFGMRNTANNTSIETLTFNSAGNVGMGGATAPTSTLTIKGNTTVGASYITTAAPANGLLVQGNVGIGTTSPAVKLDVHGGGIRIDPGTSSIPTCDASLRGTMWYVKGGSGAWDMMYVCMKEDIDIYSWINIAP